MFAYSHFIGGGSDHAAGHIAARFSDDGGRTWSEKDVVLVTREGDFNVMSVSLLRLQSGEIALLLLWNNHDQVAAQYRGKRTPFNVAVSRDDGRTWEHTKTLEDDPRGWYCYTALAFVGDEVLLGHCAGDRRKGGLNTTQITQFSLDWLYDRRVGN